MLLVSTIIIILLTLTLITLSQVLPNLNLNQEKTSPYECGFDPINSPRLPFSFRFFLVALLFLIFDLEIALLLATPLSITFLNISNNVLIIYIFLIVLSFGLWYEWENNGLDWII